MGFLLLFSFVLFDNTWLLGISSLEEKRAGHPWWLSGLAPGRDPGVPGSSPASGFLHGACFSLCPIYLSLYFCVCLDLCRPIAEWFHFQRSIIQTGILIFTFLLTLEETSKNTGNNNLFFFKKDFIYLFMTDTEIERQIYRAEGEAGSMQGA